MMASLCLYMLLKHRTNVFFFFSVVSFIRKEVARMEFSFYFGDLRRLHNLKD